MFSNQYFLFVLSVEFVVGFCYYFSYFIFINISCTKILPCKYEQPNVFEYIYIYIYIYTYNSRGSHNSFIIITTPPSDYYLPDVNTTDCTERSQTPNSDSSYHHCHNLIINSKWTIDIFSIHTLSTIVCS